MSTALLAMSLALDPSNPWAAPPATSDDSFLSRGTTKRQLLEHMRRTDRHRRGRFNLVRYADRSPSIPFPQNEAGDLIEALSTFQIREDERPRPQ